MGVDELPATVVMRLRSDSFLVIPGLTRDPASSFSAAEAAIPTEKGSGTRVNARGDGKGGSQRRAPTQSAMSTSSNTRQGRPLRLR
jgi:hypothetical protein